MIFIKIISFVDIFTYYIILYCGYNTFAEVIRNFLKGNHIYDKKDISCSGGHDSWSYTVYLGMCNRQY